MEVPVVAQRHHDLEAEAPRLGDGVVQSPKYILSENACGRKLHLVQVADELK